MARCTAKTKAGMRCKAQAVTGTDACARHTDPNSGHRLLDDPALADRIAEIMEQGKPRSYAAAACGVPPRTAERWYLAGQRPDATPHEAAFYERASIARKIGSEVLAARIRAAGETRTHTRVDRHGNRVEVTDPGDWRADAWMLERIDPDEYGQRATLQHTGRDGGAVEISITRDEVTQEAARRFLDTLDKQAKP